MKQTSSTVPKLSSRPLRLKYYMFDWDDNILHMPTRIHLERKVGKRWVKYDVSTAKFAEIRRDTVNYRPPRGNWDRAFLDFYDVGKRGKKAFLDDTRKALRPVLAGRERPAPSFYKFKKSLIEGRLFAIITARSHASECIRMGVEYFIKTVLSADEQKRMVRHLRRYIKYFGGVTENMTDRQILASYLDLNHYRGVTSPEFQKLMGRKTEGSESPEQAKQFAIKVFVKHVAQLIQSRPGGEKISVGFSDDDRHNITSVGQFLRNELSRQYPHFKFVVYDTSKAKSRVSKMVIRRT